MLKFVFTKTFFVLVKQFFAVCVMMQPHKARRSLNILRDAKTLTIEMQSCNFLKIKVLHSELSKRNLFKIKYFALGLSLDCFWSWS